MSASVFFSQWLKRKRRLLNGVLNRGRSLYSGGWWDEVFYSSGVESDASTISKYTSSVVSGHHYSSIELLLFEYLHNNGFASLAGKRVLDIGSGSGHWIDFFSRIGVSDMTGIDVSERSCDFLRKRFCGGG